MNRNRYRASRPLRDQDGEYVTKSDYYPGAGGPAPPPQRRHARPAFFSRLTRGHYRGVSPTRQPMNPDALPMHQQPNQMHTRQVAEWGEVRSLAGESDELVFNEARDQREDVPVRFTPTTAPRPAAEAYEEGDSGVGEYNLYQDDARGNDLSETGRMKQRETRAARVERFANA